MMPARKASAFEVVEAKLALEIFVGALCSPALHDNSYELLLRHARWQRGEEVVGRLVFVVSPLDQQPLVLSLFRQTTIVGSRNDPQRSETRAQVVFCALAPSTAPEASASIEFAGQGAQVLPCRWQLRIRIEQPHFRLRVDANSVVQAKVSHLAAKDAAGKAAEAAKDAAGKAADAAKDAAAKAAEAVKK